MFASTLLALIAILYCVELEFYHQRHQGMDNQACTVMRHAPWWIMAFNLAAALDEAADVTHSNAFNILNALVDEGVIIEARAEYLKEKFKELHTHVLTIYKRDNLLLKRARQLRNALDQEREKVRSQGEIARTDDAEIQRLKATLLEKEKELVEAQERESVLQVEALEYDRRKQYLILEREDAKAAEEARLRPKMENLQREIHALGTQMNELLSEYEDLKLQQARLLEKEVSSKSEIASFATTLAQAKQQLLSVERDPERLQKQLYLVNRSLLGAKKELSLAEEKLATQTELHNKMELQLNNRTNDRNAAVARVQKLRSEIDPKCKTLSTLMKSLEMEMESRQGYQERLVELGQFIKAANTTERQERDGIERLQREKERCIREHLSLKQSQSSLLEEQQELKKQLSLILAEKDEVEGVCKATRRKIEDSRKDVEVQTKRLLKEQSKDKDFIERSQRLTSDLNDTNERIAELVRREDVKRRELVAIATQRQGLNLESMCERSRVTLVKHEVHTKKLYHRELVHSRDELEKRLQMLMESFQAIKRERSQKAMLIQVIKQKTSEVTEKTKIVEKELEVLLCENALKESELIQRKRQAIEAEQLCVALRIEKNNRSKELEAALDAKKVARSLVCRLNTDIIALEDNMVRLRENYATVVENRNQTGIRFIDRNDELCLLTEKVKAQEAALEQGLTMTNARAEEVKRLKLQLADLQREIELCQRSIPKVKQMERELVELGEKIEDERWRTEILENDLTDPNNVYRWRLIGKVDMGDDSACDKSLHHTPTTLVEGKLDGARVPNEQSGGSATTAPPDTTHRSLSEEHVRLQARTQELEHRVNLINEKLREKQLILAEVRELSERIGSQAQSGKDITIALAKQVNQQQCGIRNKTWRMMSTISELSIFQASSIQLQQEVERLEQVVAEAERRMEDGETPFAEAEEEFVRRRVERKRYAEFLQRRHDAKHSALALDDPKAVVTTADSRPNSYIPDTGLPIPKPFGAHCPFKSTFPALSLTPAGTGTSTSFTATAPAASRFAPHVYNTNAKKLIGSTFQGNLNSGVSLENNSSLPFSSQQKQIFAPCIGNSSLAKSLTESSPVREDAFSSRVRVNGKDRQCHTQQMTRLSHNVFSKTR